MRFQDLHLSPALLRALDEEQYERPTPIQSRAIPPVLEGLDVLGIAQTGTGKTAAFALPILHRLERSPAPHSGRRSPRVLVVAPTRELAAQIGDSFRTYGRHLKFRTSVVFGGVGQRPQEEELRRGVDILVACPGRLLDLMGQSVADLSGVEVLVLDEADRMLDMGFLPDIRRIVKSIPSQRQTLFFSATMPEEIRDLADGLLHQPVTVQVAPAATAAETVDQSVAMVEKEAKAGVLEDILKDAQGRTLVFTRTKHGADRVAKRLARAGITAMAIHGDKSQGARTKALDGFRDGSVPVLVASDIAARGLDIDEIRLVVNYDIPADPDTYVHRIGRTGRAGASGRAVTFVTSEDAAALKDIEKRIGRGIPWLQGHEGTLGGVRKAPSPAPKQAPRPKEGHSSSGGRSGRGGRGQSVESRRSNESKASRGGDSNDRRDRRSRDTSRESSNSSSQEGSKRRGRRRGRAEGPSSNGSESRGRTQPSGEQGSLLGRIWNRLTGGKG